jgi:Rho termination factor, N-terminal domain
MKRILEKMTISELRKEAKRRKLQGYSGLSKADLLVFLEKHAEVLIQSDHGEMPATILASREIRDRIYGLPAPKQPVVRILRDVRHPEEERAHALQFVRPDEFESIRQPINDILALRSATIGIQANEFILLGESGEDAFADAEELELAFADGVAERHRVLARAEVGGTLYYIVIPLLRTLYACEIVDHRTAQRLSDSEFDALFDMFGELLDIVEELPPAAGTVLRPRSIPRKDLDG